MESDDTLITKYEYVANMNSDDYDESNFESTTEEETLLEYVESFRRQFIQLFPSRQESLFMTPANEYGVNKFLPSSFTAQPDSTSRRISKTTMSWMRRY